MHGTAHGKTIGITIEIFMRISDPVYRTQKSRSVAAVAKLAFSWERVITGEPGMGADCPKTIGGIESAGPQSGAIDNDIKSGRCVGIPSENYGRERGAPAKANARINAGNWKIFLVFILVILQVKRFSTMNLMTISLLGIVLILIRG